MTTLLTPNETPISDRVTLTVLRTPGQVDWLIRLDGAIHVHYRYKRSVRKLGGRYPGSHPFVVPGIRSMVEATAFVDNDAAGLATSHSSEAQS